MSPKRTERFSLFSRSQDPGPKSTGQSSSRSTGLLKGKTKGKWKSVEEDEKLERWLVSYADFITLLFTFFVTMYGISRVDEQRLASAVISLQNALNSLGKSQLWKVDNGVIPSGGAPIHIIPASIPKAEPKNSERAIFEDLSRKIQKDIEGLSTEKSKNTSFRGNQIGYLINESGLIIRIPERLFFDSGEAAIHPKVIPILDILVQSLGEIQNQIRIEGHTDNVPINTIHFPSNWELSTARANAIIRYFLTKHNFDPSRISAVGYAEFRPIAPNDNSEGRQQNRRVDVVVLSEGHEEKGDASYRH